MKHFKTNNNKKNFEMELSHKEIVLHGRKATAIIKLAEQM